MVLHPNKPLFFDIFPGQAGPCLERLSMGPIRYKYALYLHVCEAYRTFLSLLPTILLSSPQFLTSPLCLTLTLLPHN
jgi:hypothetical protein